MKTNHTVWRLVPIMLCFFIMGYVDFVGIATNYVKEDFGLSNKMASIFPSMVFFWFLILSVPTGMLMNKIGRRNTVLISLVVTLVSLLFPLISYSFTSMLISFSLLGIGNTLIQVSLNPLLSTIVSDKQLASSITFGQFVKAIASFIAPIIAVRSAVMFDDWRYLYPIFMVIAILTIIILSLTKIKEQEENSEVSTFGQCFALLGNKMILLSFLGIICHVGIDVGINITAPNILKERLGMLLEDAGYVTSLYFMFRTIGCFLGAFILAKVSSKRFFTFSIILMLLGFGGLLFTNDLMPIYVCVALIGLGNSNIFPIIMSQALLSRPEKKNEISGLLIMGLFGGTIFPIIMGFASDEMNSQIGALLVMLIGVAYLFFFATRLKKNMNF